MALKKLNNEYEILHRVGGGDEKAFAMLFHAYFSPLRKFINLIINDEDDADEIVQEVFTRLWVKRESLTTVNNFEGYVFMISRNLTLNYIRAAVNERKRREIFLRDNDTLEEMPGEYLREDYHEVIERAIDSLPPRQQQVFKLRQQGLKNPEISKQLQLSIDSVKRYQYLALKYISEFVQSQKMIPAFAFFLLCFLDKK